MKFISKYCIAVLLILYSGCGKGIEPLPVETTQQKAGFSGTITFNGNWQQNVKHTFLVVFKNPLNSPGDFNALNLSYLSLEIPYGVKEYKFSSLDSSYVPISIGEYSYVAVAQSDSTNIILNRTAWHVAGVYYADNDTTKPGKLIIPEHKLVTDINILCDFNNPPKQPPGGN